MESTGLTLMNTGSEQLDSFLNDTFCGIANSQEVEKRQFSQININKVAQDYFAEDIIFKAYHKASDRFSSLDASNDLELKSLYLHGDEVNKEDFKIKDESTASRISNCCIETSKDDGAIHKNTTAELHVDMANLNVHESEINIANPIYEIKDTCKENDTICNIGSIIPNTCVCGLGDLIGPNLKNGKINYLEEDVMNDKDEALDAEAREKATRSSTWMKFDPNKIVGLINTGTNCHANSVIQCLVRCEPLRLWVLTCRPRKCYRPNKTDFCCFCALRSVFRRFATTDHSFYGTRNLIRGLSDLTHINFGDESDANEFALILLDTASSHHLQYHKDADSIKYSTSTSRSNGTQHADQFNSDYSWIDRIVDFSDLFTLKINRKFQCNSCKESSSITETHPVVHLPSLNHSLLVQQLEDFIYQRSPNRKCSRCRRNIKQKSFVKYRPPILIVAIPRVNTFLRKTKQKLVYGKKVNLEFADRMRSSSPPSVIDNNIVKSSKAENTSLKSTYDLSTVITHTGSQSSGHYSAIVRAKPSKWSLISDEDHYKMRANEVFCRDDATLLFYITDFTRSATKRKANATTNRRVLTLKSNKLNGSCNQSSLNVKSSALITLNRPTSKSLYIKEEKKICTKTAKNSKAELINENDENNPDSIMDNIDLSLSASANSLFKMGCKEETPKLSNLDEEWGNLDCPRVRKRTRKSGNETAVNNSFHKFVHSGN